MMMKKLEKKCAEYKIDLSSVDGDGSFQCPYCGMKISPDDESEDNYEILDTKVVDDELAELDISCGKCGSNIKLTGFQAGLEA
jgi:DNA-directed RNA polymerase subunit RPC12/RpoP